MATTVRAARYDPQQFEQKWQSAWDDERLYRADDASTKPKYYLLDFFPYPSGEGLHVGHSKQYIGTDVATRYLRMRGYNVLHPMGWDAFGLPAENEAIIQQVPPFDNVPVNVANFKRQLRLQGISFDWDREIDSSDPNYYRWTQWFFLLMYHRGLAYRARGMQWWCPLCKTILANEQVENGFCWRHPNQPVEKKELEQWYFRITDYAEELLRDLDTLNWPERIILMQRNWIGKSVGAEITFEATDAAGKQQTIAVFTTRPDTIYGATFMVLSPEHPLVGALTTPEHRARVVQYQQAALHQSEIDRLSTDREKTGVFTGSHAVNPFTGEAMPIWIADYVLMSYGTGAIMAVPAGDERDWEFARKYSLPIRQVVSEDGAEVDAAGAYTGPGFMVNSGPFTGLSTDEGKAAIVATLEERGIGRGAVTYRMRDWLVSRQRYWGAPIPIVYCRNCGAVPVPEDQLPVLLPRLERYEPGDDGRSPLATDPDFVHTTCPTCGGPAERETDTLDTFVDSSWYYLRFTSPHDANRPFDEEQVRYWCPLDLYVGGAEHAVMHLLYFRFFAKVLADAGMVDFREPALRLLNQGTLHAPDGHRMSKSKHNVITPDSVAAEYGADTLRGYMVFMGPFTGDVIWSPQGINGVHRWLSRVWDIAQPAAVGRENRQPEAENLQRVVNKTIKRVGRDLESFDFNTAVSALMELTNELQRVRPALEGSSVWNWAVERLVLMLAPIAPHLTEELWHRHGHDGSVHRQEWPTYDEALTLDEVVTVVVQVNGKVRDRLEVPRGEDIETVAEQALASPRVQPYLDNRRVVKIVKVPDRLVNIVVA
ncbi:MAG TPA: leucine--tRNA ligase [Chloroflexota bacterium]|nr:leucine--tRNA ligase [Chloroflexota bacterium]